MKKQFWNIAILIFVCSSARLGHANSTGNFIPNLFYHPTTGEVIIDPDGRDVIAFVLTTSGGNEEFQIDNVDFSGVPFGLVDLFPTQIGWLSDNVFNGITTPVSLGNILPVGLSIGPNRELDSFLNTRSYGLSLAGGGGGGDFELPVPEPSSKILWSVALTAMVFWRRRHENIFSHANRTNHLYAYASQPPDLIEWQNSLPSCAAPMMSH